jgi:hypothetical protein
MTGTFQHRFKGGITATMTVDDNYAPGTTHILAIEWSRKPKERIIPEYMRWVHVVNERVATESGKKIMHVFMLPGNEVQSWVYEPNRPAQRVFA